MYSNIKVKKGGNIVFLEIFKKILNNMKFNVNVI